MDIHTKLMAKYKQVPEWWFVIILVANIAATLFACQYYNDQLQLPWWGVLLACALAFIFTLPIGIITAITNQVIFLTNEFNDLLTRVHTLAFGSFRIFAKEH